MRNIIHKRSAVFAVLAAVLLCLFLPERLAGTLPDCLQQGSFCLKAHAEETITLRVCNWEEYIDM